MNVKNYTLVSAGDLSANFNSPSIGLEFYSVYSIQCVWTGTPVGFLKLQISNDPPVYTTPVVNWSDYTGTTTATGGAAGNFMYNVFPGAYCWVRVVYTSTSGAGSLLINVTGKG